MNIQQEDIKYNDRFGDVSGWTEEEKKEATEDHLRSMFPPSTQTDCIECGDPIAHGTRCSNCLGK